MAQFRAGTYKVHINAASNSIEVGCQKIPFYQVIKLANHLNGIIKKQQKLPSFRYRYRQDILQHWNEIPVLGIPRATEKRTIV